MNPKYEPGLKNDPVNHPSHYTNRSMECIDIIKVMVEGLSGYDAWLVGQVVKYLYRFNSKDNPLQDLQKSEFYLNRLIGMKKEGGK